MIRLGLRGTAETVRYADDFLVLFEDAKDAERFAQTLPERLAKFGLEVAPEKTGLIPFGRKLWRQGKGAARTFDFLGLSHHLATPAPGPTRAAEGSVCETAWLLPVLRPLVLHA
ncbi:MAG: hypothetical protein K6V73_01695 [Firmicutes bacterium]|nr:hypothetical protein [Bacillota bacterium]